jgi:mRNA interferase MazF
MNYQQNDVMRGEVYYFRYNDSVGSEIGIGRPGVIVSNDRGNKNSPVVNVIMMTTTPKNMDVTVKLHTPKKQSWALCNQIFTYDKQRLGTYMCILDDEEMGAIDEGLRKALALGSEVEEDEEYEESDEIVELTAERDLYKRLYERVLDMMTDVTLRGSGKVEKCEKPVEKPVEKCEPRKVVEPDGKVNVNTASEEEMMRVAGMGRQLVSRIRCYRDKHGPFESVEELLNVDKFGSRCMVKYGDKLKV